MLKLLLATYLCLTTVAALCQSAPKYEVATILEVKTHQAPSNDASDTSYDVTVQVGDRIYLALYKDRFGLDIVKHKTGGNLLVQVGKNTITYLDILGQSIEVPIISERAAIAPAQSK